MSKKIKMFLLLPFFIISNSVKSEMSPENKTVGVMAVYGAVGGALLGAASLVFVSSSRAIPVGASLGLYSGLLFGGYVVLSHSYGKKRSREKNYYPDTKGSPYESVPFQESNDKGGYGTSSGNTLNKKLKKQVPIYYVQLLHLTF